MSGCGWVPRLDRTACQQDPVGRSRPQSILPLIQVVLALATNLASMLDILVGFASVSVTTPLTSEPDDGLGIA